MLKRYLEFVNESLEFILESEVVYSDKFRLALNKIESPISKSILDIENKDLDVRSNYFDIIMDANDAVSFIPDARAQRILGDEKEKVRFVGNNGGWLTYNKSESGEYKNKKLFDELGFTPPEDGEIVKPQGDEVGEIVKKVTSDKTDKTYAWVKFGSTEIVINVDKLRSVDDRLQRVWSTNRQQIKVGRAIRALLGIAGAEFVDKDIEDFVNQYKATIDKFNDKFSFFEEVKEDKIAYWYDSSRYFERRGTLGSSCMSSVDPEYFDIYVSNPNVCSLVILKSQEDTDKISGRALLWTLTDGKRFMDRIYTINDSDVQLFRDWAKENGWYIKQYNGSSSSPNLISPEGENIILSNLTVNIKPGYYESYPYLDTLKYWNKNAGTLSTSGSSNTYILEGTGGEYIQCEYCDGSGRRTCYECDGDGDWECGNCDGSGMVGKGEDEEECTRCDGEGRITCDECRGDGVVDCPECN